MPKISIIMPVYNTQQYLNQSIRSVMNQSFTDFELILINDGSTDYSLLYCKVFAMQDSRVRLLDLPHCGITVARLVGIAAARGDYVGFVDSDDWVENDYLLHLVQAIRAEDADISMGPHVKDFKDNSVEFFFPDGSYRGNELYELIRSDVYCCNDRSQVRLSHFIWDKLFKKSLLLENIKYLDKRLVWGEDTLLFVASILSSQCFTVHNVCDYHHCMRENSITHQNLMDFDKTLLYYHLTIEMLKQKGYSCLNEKAETEILKIVLKIIEDRSDVELQPLPEDFSRLIEAQPVNDGDGKWAEDIRFLKNYIKQNSKREN